MSEPKLYTEYLSWAEVMGQGARPTDEIPPVPSLESIQQTQAPADPVEKFRERVRQLRMALTTDEFRAWATETIRQFPTLASLIETYSPPVPLTGGETWSPEAALAKLDGGEPAADAALAKLTGAPVIDKILEALDAPASDVDAALATLDGQSAATREAVSDALLRLSTGEACR